MKWYSKELNEAIVKLENAKTNIIQVRNDLQVKVDKIPDELHNSKYRKDWELINTLNDYISQINITIYSLYDTIE